MIATKTFELEDEHITLCNFYRWEIELFASNIFVTLAHIKHNEKYFLIGKYKLFGVCTKLYSNKNLYGRCAVYGNPICIETISGKALHYIENNKKVGVELRKAIKNNEDKTVIQNISEKYMQSQERNDPKDFEGYNIETYCYVTLKEYEKLEDFNLEEIKEMTPELFEKLMCDIPGSCG